MTTTLPARCQHPSRQRITADHRWPQAESGKPGGYTQPDISDPEQGQLATLPAGPGRRVSGVKRLQDLSANVLNSPVDSCLIRGI